MSIKCAFLLLVFPLTLLSLPREASANNDCVDGQPVVVCYYASWGIYRPGNGTHKIADIDPKLCSHLIYSFAGLDQNGVITSLDPHNDIVTGGFFEFNRLKEVNPCLKTLIAIGGWNEGSEKYSLMAETASRRQAFADSVLRFLVHYGFDGLNMDWEYPTQRGGIPADKENFVALLKTLRDAFRSRQKLLTVSLGVSPWIIETAYNVEEICDAVDLVLVMAYDLQDTARISVHAPLWRDVGEDEHRVTIHDGIWLLKNMFCDPRKIILGIGGYGRSYTMTSAESHQIGQVAAGVGKAGPYVREEGALGFNEICEALVSGQGWQVTRLGANAISYAYRAIDRQWVSYDDVESIARKADYVRQERLGGLMMYSIDTDDFHGHCLGERYPLLKAMNRALNRTVV